MTNEELRSLYDKAGLRQADFINWAKGHGVIISRATASRHASGPKPIPGPSVLAYKWFFSYHGL